MYTYIYICTCIYTIYIYIVLIRTYHYISPHHSYFLSILLVFSNSFLPSNLRDISGNAASLTVRSKDSITLAHSWTKAIASKNGRLKTVRIQDLCCWLLVVLVSGFPKKRNTSWWFLSHPLKNMFVKLGIISPQPPPRMYQLILRILISKNSIHEPHGPQNVYGRIFENQPPNTSKTLVKKKRLKEHSPAWAWCLQNWVLLARQVGFFEVDSSMNGVRTTRFLRFVVYSHGNLRVPPYATPPTK